MRHLQHVIGEYGLYEHDVTIIREIGPFIKVSKCRSVRKKGLEAPHDQVEKNVSEIIKKIADYDKLEAAISRAKRIIKEYALCNDWDYFVTLTIDGKKFDRKNLKTYYKVLGEFIHNYNRRCLDGEKVRYILIPELHADGENWHIHGLIKGIRPKDLISNSNGYLEWKQYTSKFGYMSLGAIKDKNRVSSYITKYISKAMARTVNEYGANLYYCSKGLKTSEIIYRGNDVQMSGKWDFERPDGFCKIKWYDDGDAFADEISIGVEYAHEGHGDIEARPDLCYTESGGDSWCPSLTHESCCMNISIKGCPISTMRNGGLLMQYAQKRGLSCSATSCAL